MLLCTTGSKSGTAPSGPGRAAFTLVELLVVVAILSLLISMLMPSLGRAKEMARKTMCMTNMKGMGLGLRMYVEQNDQFVPPFHAIMNEEAINGKPQWTWYWCDFLVSYCDESAKPAQWKSGDWWTVGRQPRSGNYYEHAPDIVYSQMMNCPSQERENKFQYCYNRTWRANFTPGAAQPQWDSTPRKMGYYRRPQKFAIIVEPRFLWNTIYFGGSRNYIPKLADSPVHLGNKMNFTMLDGHVETWTSEEIRDRSFQVLRKYDLPFVTPR